MKIFWVLLGLLPFSQFAHADCSETPMSYAKFSELAQAPGSNDVESFLGKLPKDSMSNVTLVRESNSFPELKKAITPALPGVIRGTANSKLIFRYVCDPTSTLKSDLEVIRFDDEAKEFKFSVVHFAKNQIATITESPENCATCHQSKNNAFPIMKPIFGSYPKWPGMYGASNDLESSSEFLQFTRDQKNNPCYSASLPYYFNDLYKTPLTHNHGRYSNLRRPNLRFNVTLALLEAKSVAAKILQNPRYLIDQNLKDLGSMVFSCGLSKKEAETLDDIYTRSQSSASKPFLDELNSSEMSMGDLDLRFEGHGTGIEFDYIPALYKQISAHYGTSEVNILAVIRGQLALEFAKIIPALREQFILTRGTSEHYTDGDQSCIDDLGGVVLMEDDQRNRTCELLKSYHTSNGENQTSEAPSKKVISVAPEVQVNAKSIELKDLSNEPGYKQIEASCARCHRTEADSAKGADFLKNSKELSKRLQTNPSYALKMLSRINSKSSPMPPDETLDENESRTIIHFLESYKLTQ